MKLTIPSDIYNIMLAASRAVAPLEACGLLGGVDDAVEQFYELENTDAAAEHYTMAPEAQFAAVKDMRDVCTPIYQSEDMCKNFASLSRMVMETALEGDEVAIEVVREGARQIGIFLTACADQLGMADEPYRIAATGGLVSSGGWYFDLVQENVRKKHPKATLVKPKFEPCVGSVLLALKEIGIEWNDKLVTNMERTLKTIEA